MWHSLLSPYSHPALSCPCVVDPAATTEVGAKVLAVANVGLSKNGIGAAINYNNVRGGSHRAMA